MYMYMYSVQCMNYYHSGVDMNGGGGDGWWRWGVGDKLERDKTQEIWEPVS